MDLVKFYWGYGPMLEHLYGTCILTNRQYIVRLVHNPMERNMHRFSRDKRFFSRISFEEFAKATQSLVSLVLAAKPAVSIEVLTCEDEETYNYSNVTFLTSDAVEACTNRQSYSISELTQEVWNRSLKIEMYCKDSTSLESFMVTISCDRRAAPGRIAFYFHGTDHKLSEQILKEFALPTFGFSIGDGYDKPTEFNRFIGQKITGIRL